MASSEFLDGAFLFVDQSSMKSAVKIVPDGYDLGVAYQSVIANAFPYDRCTTTLVYAFTIEKHICYSWTFRFGEDMYSIVLVGRIRTPDLYLNFLRDMANSVAEQKRVIEPEVLLTLVASLISSWHFMESGNEVLVQYSKKPFVVELGPERLWLRRFKPYQCFPILFDFVAVWKALMTGERILIVGRSDRPEMLTTAFFGVLAMCRAIPYHERVALIPNHADPRNIEELASCKVIAASAEYVKNCDLGQFSVIAKLGDNMEPENDLADEDIEKRNNKLESIICFLLKINLGMDPYSDILKKPFITDDLRKQMSDKTMQYVLDVDQLFQFQEMYSTQEWRKSMLWKSDFRDKFLSMQPDEALDNKTVDELRICQNALKDMEVKFAGDRLMDINIRKHRKYLEKKLRCV